MHCIGLPKTFCAFLGITLILAKAFFVAATSWSMTKRVGVPVLQKECVFVSNNNNKATRLTSLE